MEYLLIANALVFGLLTGISITTAKDTPKHEIAVSVTVMLFILTAANIIAAMKLMGYMVGL